ncbi:hypothetical protein DEU56DRAFT_794861 [Suillus clintonianus]|uniref:uncharacterized protein n=1 Tax=Suillus clintonianus TaxID=1904413 RepID=UPI001B87FB1C|nr:uncharacterized protein DEU56DRAFT_794861 [Suillus clintonianus]KAG2141826.1 hypothetical protein DEU56DRAFT_794861 [Suillus clintonianus]
MAEDMDLDDHKSDASPPREILHPSPPNSRKRKTPPERGDSADAEGESVDDSVAVPKGEYETGRVMCEVCGEGVSFRDEATGGFTLKHWDAHRQQCANTTQAVPEPVIYTPESTAEALANPPAKRRRAKRTEEERIDYLRADPYVAQFEAYRVLCASCDKWIRLRPNSTYCSIPWDAHRKSCLSKKINNKNGCALEERNSLLSKDPDVRKFDAERVLCNTCDRWIQVSPENHMQAVQKWLQHRSSCQKGAAHSSGSQAEASSSQPPKSSPAAREGQPDPGHASSISRRPSDSPVHGKTPVPSAIPGSPSPSFKDLTPTNFPAHESRRRNAEQRAATLKADPLVEEVEPNRVFCSLCKKWVQLRQDSSYCAYPWIQHRGKCLARHQRRAQKAAEVAELRAKGGTSHPDDGSLSDEDMSAEDELESEEPYDVQVQDLPTDDKRKARISDFRSLHTAKKQRLDNGSGRTGSAWAVPDHTSTGKRSLQSVRSIRPKGRPDSDLHALVTEASGSTSRLNRRLVLGLADLNNVPGRMDFIFSSIAYLFMTTYDSTDDMTISSLLTYLNSAIPADKHEDFDTAEVVKAAAALQDRGDIIFEGDMLRLPD